MSLWWAEHFLEKLSLYSPVVTICTAQWSLYVPPSGHYMYRTVDTICTAQWSLYVSHMVTICTAQWSLYVSHMVTICTAQWSLYVPHSGHYMYCKVVTICTAQWSLYVPHSGHYMYRTVVTICTTSLTFNNSTFCPHTVLCVLCGSQNKQPLFPYTTLTDWFL